MTEHDLTYGVTVHEEDDGSFWAEVHELPGCFASGDSMDELWECLNEAVSLYLSVPGSEVQVMKMEATEVETSSRMKARFAVA